MSSVVISQPGTGFKAEEMQMQVQQGTTAVVVPEGLPPGLAYLAHQNEIMIHQQFSVTEAITGCERNNKYSLCNSADQQFMYAREDTDCCTRQMCGKMRPFTINIEDNVGMQLVQLYRPYRCIGSCMWCCCLQEMDVMSPPGVAIAKVRQVWTCVKPKYEVVDGNGDRLFTIDGECCYCMCCTDIVFRVTDAHGQEVAQIIKKWSGIREIFGQVNDFKLVFAADVKVLEKAMLIGATFLIDFIYFERNNN